MSQPVESSNAIPEKILTRVRNLLAKAEATDFPEEAETYRDKAFELMSTYGIEQAVLAASGERPDEIDTLRIELFGGDARRHATLVHAIASALGAKSIYTKGVAARTYTPKRNPFSTVVGYRSTLERVEFLYTLLLTQATGGMAKIRGVSSGHTRSMRVGYLSGFTAEVHHRLMEAERRARADYAATHTGGPSTALVLADRAALVKRRYAELFPDVRTHRASRVNAAGFEAGQRDGQLADLGGKRFGNGRTRALTF